MKRKGTGAIWELSHVELKEIDVGNEEKRYLFQLAPLLQLSQYYKNLTKLSLINSPIPQL